MDFPHMDGATSFPNSQNVRVWQQYPNSFDYSRWQADTQIKMLSVPWDGVDNVIEWESEETRDTWFAEQSGYTDVLQTELRLLPDGSVKVPLPFDASGLYNYVWVSFPVATSTEQPLDYESKTQGVRHWGYFVDGLVYRSPSCTELRLSVDWWTTFAQSVTVNALRMERGHWAMTQAASVADYLADPIAHTAWLDGQEPEQPSTARWLDKASVVINDGTQYMLFDVGACNPAGDFTDGVPEQAGRWQSTSGTPTGTIFAVAVSDLDAFAGAISQGFWQCVRACYLVSGKWLTFAGTATVGSVTILYVSGGASLTQDMHLTEADFGYDADYADLTKLYTSPYARVHILTETGQDVTIEPQELGSVQTLHLASQVTSAGVRVLSVLQGLGASEASSLSFANLTSADFAGFGVWQRTLQVWEIPTYALYQGADSYNDYRKSWLRTQATANADNAYSNATASNATAQTNAGNSASNLTANNAVAVAANNSMLSYNQQAALVGASYSNTKLTDDSASDITFSTASYTAEQAGLAVAATNNNTQVIASEIGSMVSGVASLVTGDLNGAASAIGGMVNAGVAWECSNASLAVSQSNSESCYRAGIGNANAKTGHATTYNSDATALKNSNDANIVATQNNASTSTASNNASLITTNAANAKTTADANATRTRDNAYAAITAGIHADNAGAPMSFGAVSGVSNVAIVPMCVQVKVERASDGDVARCGDDMLRYGYVCRRNVSKPSRLQVMRHYTYWQVSEAWIRADGHAPEIAVASMRRTLQNGVTIWSDPADVGAVSIYDN